MRAETAQLSDLAGIKIPIISHVGVRKGRPLHTPRVPPPTVALRCICPPVPPGGLARGKGGPAAEVFQNLSGQETRGGGDGKTTS